MKRLGQSYETIVKMSAEERDELFDLKCPLLKKKVKTNKEIKYVARSNH